MSEPGLYVYIRPPVEQSSGEGEPNSSADEVNLRMGRGGGSGQRPRPSPKTSGNAQSCVVRTGGQLDHKVGHFSKLACHAIGIDFLGPSYNGAVVGDAVLRELDLA